MFNKNLKLRIKELKTELSEKETELLKSQAVNKLLKYQVDYPPKYKAGERIGDWIILERSCKPPVDLLCSLWAVALMFNHIPSVSKGIIERIKTNSCYWQYDVVNSLTNERTTKKESELCSAATA